VKDYYRILGVMEDAEDVVIQAANKALAQRYHPDQWTGDRVEANRRMAEINEAHAVLSDPIKRKEYDSTREKGAYQEEPDETDELLATIEKDWNKAAEYLPDLKSIAQQLARTSKSLEFEYKIILLDTKSFNERAALASKLEANYLSKYFGTNETVIAYAKQLLAAGRRNAAKELNVAVGLLGSSVDPSVILKRLDEKFGLSLYEDASKKNR
jgi:curved DNA-binding protein CbpA